MPPEMFNTTKFASLTDREGKMKQRVIIYLLLVLTCAAVTVSARQAGQKSNGVPSQALRTVQRYVQLRLQDADWKEYSKVITWPDEPSWDCKWVASAHKVGTPVRRGDVVVIPVVYNRLGLFCNDFDFTPDPKIATINYELVSRASGWQVDTPIPDYPDIGADVLVKSLNGIAGSSNQSPERRTRAAATVRRIEEALKPETSPSHKQP